MAERNQMVHRKTCTREVITGDRVEPRNAIRAPGDDHGGRFGRNQSQVGIAESVGNEDEPLHP